LGGGAAFNADEITMHQVVRLPDWTKAVAGSQGMESKLINLEEEAAGEVSHFKVLFDNLTLDAEIVIYILGIMFVIAAWVMVTKFIMLRRVLAKNEEFLKAFNDADPSVFKSGTFGAASIGAAATKSKYEGSPLYEMYVAAAEQVRRRFKAAPDQERPLDSRAMNSVRAAIDSTIVNESSKLNKAMVLLTIAISGGPFIGLLGTVIGVMITFAAIAAAGDVNVNAIAPGIAAALLATVAGLAVAIPALFGYNWLASQIKEASNQMMVFADSLQSRIAESFQKV
jgi:biopolymer transport protein ExbB